MAFSPERVSIAQLVNDVYKHYLTQKKSDSKLPDIESADLTDFAEEYINEVIPNPSDSNLSNDVTPVYRQHPDWTLEQIVNEANTTVGLAEKQRYYQMFCQDPRDSEIVATSRPEQQAYCRYFEDTWKDKFPTSSNSFKSVTEMPIEKLSDDDGDSSIIKEESGELYDTRYVGIDTQESLLENDIIEKKTKKDYDKNPVTAGLIDDYCYFDKTDKEQICAYHAKVPNAKIRRHTGNVWDGMMKLLKRENPDFYKKLTNNSKMRVAVQQAMNDAGDLATIYRGEIGKYINQSITAYAASNGARWFTSASYAVPKKPNGEETKDEKFERESDGRYEGVDKYSRQLRWFYVDDENLFIDYLKDKEGGLSSFADTYLKNLYNDRRKSVQNKLDEIDFESLGLNQSEANILKDGLLGSMVDPTIAFSYDKMVSFADEWKTTSQYYSDFHYTNILNIFLVDLGVANITSDFYPNLWDKILRHNHKDAAEHRRGLFASDAYFYAFAPWYLTSKK